MSMPRENKADMVGQNTGPCPDKAKGLAGMLAWAGRRVGHRFAVSAVPAAGVTGGLFLAMAGLIAVDFTPAEAEVTRLIGTITSKPIEETKVHKRPKPQPIETAHQPPPPPRLSTSKVEVDLPVLDFPPIAPNINTGPVQVLISAPVVGSDVDARPVRPPVLSYPASAIARGIEGECSVSMNVSEKGRPYDVVATCSDSVFEREAVRAVSRVEFRPKIVGDRAVERRNVIYPLTFKLQ